MALFGVRTLYHPPPRVHLQPEHRPSIRVSSSAFSCRARASSVPFVAERRREHGFRPRRQPRSDPTGAGAGANGRSMCISTDVALAGHAQAFVPTSDDSPDVPWEAQPASLRWCCQWPCLTTAASRPPQPTGASEADSTKPVDAESPPRRAPLDVGSTPPPSTAVASPCRSLSTRCAGSAHSRSSPPALMGPEL